MDKKAAEKEKAAAEAPKPPEDSGVEQAFVMETGLRGNRSLRSGPSEPFCDSRHLSEILGFPYSFHV